jgi:Ca2+/H+ antiporter
MYQMNQFMTPIVVVVGYFSIEGDTLGFPKNAKTFSISVAILFLVLYLINLTIFMLRQHARAKGPLTRILTGQLDQLLLDKAEDGT